MSVINIREAEREGARLVLGLGGISGSGKTYTALQLAFGLANYNAKKVGLLDTENRRGSLYANILQLDGKVNKFLIGDMYAPFSPQRYADAIMEFQKVGIEVLVVDSVTHEWEGSGGCEEIATTGNPKNPRWNDAKAQHKKFMNVLLASDMHIIVCMRAREKVKLVKRDGRTEYEPQGVLPIQEKNFTFELTASLMMWDAGRQQQVIKCPDELMPILGREKGYITAEDGKALRDWIDGAKQLDPKVEHARNTLRTITEQGMKALETAWLATPKTIRTALGMPFLNELKASANEFDKQRSDGEQGGSAVAELNAAVLGVGSRA